MVALSRIREQAADTEATEPAPGSPDSGTSSDSSTVDPFSMGYDMDEWKVNAETADQALSLLMVVTNLI